MKQERIQRILDAKMMKLLQKQLRELTEFNNYWNAYNKRYPDHDLTFDQYLEQDFIVKAQSNEREAFQDFRNGINNRLNSETSQPKKQRPLGLQYSDLDMKSKRQMAELIARQVQEKQVINKILSGKSLSDEDRKKFGINYQGNKLMVGDYYADEITDKHHNEINNLLKKQERLREKFNEIYNQRKEREQGKSR